ncbi:NLR family, CARD domain containing 5 [Oryzias melastigma]|uniref:NLR family, CARD domain containing 5 n=1 Tax=Oryzias melastigma TaxID=30732 RepID=UPI000CF801F1|nr:NLR family, CARD domain containing 5 [Oryzias melastigma]XP_036068390.1 NLR family, CARD domain containing 5 [Oryzias melastigma]
MDNDSHLEDKDVNSVLAQESSKLCHILSNQSESVIRMLYQRMIDEDECRDKQATSTASAWTSADHVKALLDYYRSANATKCRIFLQSVCMLCEGIPMHLEARLMSVACSGCDGAQSSEDQPIKRPRIDYWEEYVVEGKNLLISRWRRLTDRLVKAVELDKVWVNFRNVNRGRDRPDQTPASSDRGFNTAEPDGDYGFSDSKVTLENFLRGCKGKVTFLVGQAGSGKTLLMSCLGQQWGNGLGPFPASYLLVLLEFRQLNQLSRSLSLSELLFQHYLPSNRGNDAEKAIVDYLLSNPEQSCWVLDGYDEFHWKIKKHRMPCGVLNLEEPLPVADLISGLLNRQLLPGSTVLVTCRARDIVDFDSVSDKVGELLEWDQNEIKEYVHRFFGVEDRTIGVEATKLLLSNRHLLAMSSVPALCNICCICLKHLLLKDRDANSRSTEDEQRSKATKNTIPTKEMDMQVFEKEKDRRENETQNTQHSGEREESQDMETKTANGRENFSATSAQVPNTLTQVYLTAVAAFLSRHPDQGGGDNRPKAARSSLSNTVNTLSTVVQYPSELCELSQVAWKGLEESKILFMKEDVPENILKLSVKTRLFSQVELRCHDGDLVNAYSFIHLTVQEFLAALRIMTSHEVSDAQLKKRFSLKTRWTTKSNQKTPFTDSLYLYVCGLASPNCTEVLVRVARASGMKGVQSWVQKRQALVLNLLKPLCHSNTLTGPKLLQLCRCIQESQNHELAQEAVSSRPTLELRNFRLLPNDIDALAFVVNSAADDAVGLDFGACSMEPECLDALSRCQCIHYLSFHSRKYNDQFAENLSCILPGFPNLKKLEFSGASLTAAGAKSLASALQKCCNITEINLSDNNLQDDGIGHVVELFTKLPNLISVLLGRNNTSLQALNIIVEKMGSCVNIQQVYADGMKEVTVTFSKRSDGNGHKTKPEPTISLLNQNWNKLGMQNLVKSLVNCPALSVLDLSGGCWDEETLKTFTHFVPNIKISNKIVLNDSCSSVESLVMLVALLSDCPLVMELSIRLQNPVQVSVVFPVGTANYSSEMIKTLCLRCCKLIPAHLDRVWQSLRTTSGLTHLNLSSNCLGDKGLKKLLDFLPHLDKIREINASNNDLSMEGGAVMLAEALCSHNNLTQIQISHEGKDQVILQFNPEKSEIKQQTKIFRILNSNISPSIISKVCRMLINCLFHLELEFSFCSFEDKALENMVRMLPKMSSLRRLGVDSSITSTNDALILASCLKDNNRVTSVDLSPQSESFIQFGCMKTEHVSFRLTHFFFSQENVQMLLQILKQEVRLSYLDLSGNQLGDAGVKCLVDFLPNLQISCFVNVSNNRLSQQGVLDVVSTLHSSSNVCAVEVSLSEDERCLIWFEGGHEKSLSVRDCILQQDHLIRLAEIVSNCPSLSKIDFKNSLLQSEWIEGFVNMLKPSQTGCSVSFEESWIKAEQAVDLLRRCMELKTNIQAIRIHHGTLHLTLKETFDPTSARTPTVDQNASMNRTTQCSLTEMDFFLDRLDVEEHQYLFSLLPLLPNLTCLSVAVKEGSMSIVEELSQVISQSASIQSLNLSGHVINDPAAHSMTAFLPRLRSINLSHCVWSPAGELQVIKALQQSIPLENLCLDCVQLSEVGWTALAQVLNNSSSIRSLRLNEIVKAGGQIEADRMLDLLTVMEGNAQIEEIGLDAWRMSEGGIQQLTKFLPDWKELKIISLSKNLIGDPSGEKLLDALRSCILLKELHLSGNGLGDLTAAKMSLVLPSLTHLTVLDISENHLGRDGAAALSTAVRSLKKLTRINLTSVGTSELSLVAASLAGCPLIQDVGLGWNSCGDDVALELSGLLPFCHKLARIDLECNLIGVSGVEALVKASWTCPSLQVIRLWKNKVPLNEQQRWMLKDRRLTFSST